MKPIILCILDGIGIREGKKGNALIAANTPTLDYLFNNYPNSLLEASGTDVGLPEGQMGNSEVGHMNIGAGRVVYQPLPYINEQIKSGSFFNNENIIEVINHTLKNNSSLHLLGLVSDGGVHSHIDHLMSLIDMCKEQNVKKLFLHLFLDGRDTLPSEGLKFLNKVEKKLSQTGVGKIATVSGRYYSMDRDNRWDRTNKAYQAIVLGDGERYNTVSELINSNLNRGITDEFVIPAIINEDGIVNSNDGLIAFNFRPDRLRQLFKAITNKNFNKFAVKKLKNIKLVTMMNVSDEVNCKVAFQLKTVNNTLGEYLSDLGLKQLRIAETEKYAHVTYFFDGGVEKDLKGCKRVLIPSPKVNTYDLKPEMSAYEITDVLIKELNNNYDLIVLNFANGDMVGHTGNFDAAVKAVETVDKCLEVIYTKSKEIGATLIVTADHGNCEYMLDDNDNVITSHSTNKAPFIIANKEYELSDGSLGNIAPTILEILNIEKPVEMSLESLILNKNK